MTKFRKSIIIFGCIILCAVGALVAFLTLSASGMIETDPIELTLTVQDNEKEYDGTPLTAEQYTLTSGKLLQGHKISVTYIGEQTEVGNGKSSLSAKILDEKERDVSKKYIIRVEGGELDVTMRSLVVTQKEVEREYTGEQVPGGDYTVEAGTSLCAGHRLVRSTDESGITNVGTGLDAAIPLVYDVFGNDVTGNYEIDYTPGKITVQPRKLEIAPIDATKEYDGTPLYADHRITYGTLLQGHRLNVVYKRAGDETDDGSSYGLLQAGEAKIAVSRVTVSDENGNDVTGNYLITPSVADATLRVTKRALRVAGVGGSWVYDGLSHDTKDSTEIPEDKLDGLCSTDKIAVEYKADITNVGTKPNMYEVTVKNGGDDVTKSYSITYTYDDLTVTARTVNLTLDRPSGKEYDGEPVSLDIVQEIGFTVQEGETITADQLDALREEVKGALRTEVLRDGEEVFEVNDAGTYTYTVVLAEGENANFTLGNRASELRGKVDVLPRKITVGLKEYSALRGLYTYRGETIPVPVEDVVKTVNGLAVDTLDFIEESEEKKWAQTALPHLRVMTELTVFDAGEYAFTVEIAETCNFAIDGSRTDGSFTVQQKALAISALPRVEKPYADGNEIQFELDEVLDTDRTPVTDDDLEKLYLDKQNSITQSGTYAYVVRPKDAKNYTISGADRGDLVVSRRSIDIRLKECEIPYDPDGGITIGLHDVIENYGIELENVLRLTPEQRIADTGWYAYTVEVTDTNHCISQQIDATTTKEVLQLRGYMQVTPLPVQVTLQNNLNEEYDARIKQVDEERVVDRITTADGVDRKAKVMGLLQLSLQGVPKNAGDYPFTVRLVDPKNNYTLTVPQTGTFTIGQKRITVNNYTGKTAKVYDGQPFVCDINALELQQPDIDELLTVVSAVTDFGDANVGDKHLTVRQIGLRNAKGEDVTQNYSFAEKYWNGNITRSPLKIVVNMPSLMRVKDYEDGFFPMSQEDKEDYCGRLVQLSNETPLMGGDRITKPWSVTVNDTVYEDGKIHIVIDTNSMQINNDAVKNYEVETKDGYILVTV